MEAMVYSFPSDLCTDGGRAINNSDPNWPETLQGKAKEMYDAFKARAQAAGLQAQGDDHQLPRRDSGRRRVLPELGAAGRRRERQRCADRVGARSHPAVPVRSPDVGHHVARRRVRPRSRRGRFWRLPSLGSSNSTRS